MQPEKYAFTVRVHKQDLVQYGFELIKKNLARQVADGLIALMMDSGNYHVMKMDIGRREGLFLGKPIIEFYLRVEMSIAEQIHVRYAKIEPGYMTHKEKVYERVCLHCGNALRLDERGGCRGCGAPNGGYR